MLRSSLAPRRAGSALAARLALATSAMRPAAAPGAAADTGTLRRIVASREFTGESAGRLRWLDGDPFTALERTPDGSASEIVRYDAATGGTSGFRRSIRSAIR